MFFWYAKKNEDSLTQTTYAPQVDLAVLLLKLDNKLNKKMIKYSFKLLFIFLLFTACKVTKIEASNAEKIIALSERSQKVRDYVKKDIVIAHRGTTYWAPEETQPAFLWARNIGADYLEFDIQQTKDGKLVAFHDKDLIRTTNVEAIFPERAKSPINDFTLEELRSLDAGSWFNKANPTRARESFNSLVIMTLKDVVMIAEGKKIATKNGNPIKEIIEGKWTGQYRHENDPNDNGHRPGIYIETKYPTPNVEKLLADELTDLGWNINKSPKIIQTNPGKVGVANTNARVILQTFSLKSNVLIEKHMPNIPKCLLLWQPKMADDISGNMKKAIEFCIENNVHFMGTSIAGAPNNYEELTSPKLAKMIHDAGMLVHPYTFDTVEQLNEYKDRIEGVFTNRADLALEFYNNKRDTSPQEVLNNLEF